MAIGGKTLGFSVGAGGAVAYAKDATTVTEYLIGFPIDPVKFQEAVSNLLNGAWGAVIIVIFLYVGYLINRAQERWDVGEEEQPEPAKPTTLTVNVAPAGPATPPAPPDTDHIKY